MSNKSNSDGCATGIFGLMFFGVIAIGATIVNFFRTPTEVRLQNLNQPADWGTVVQTSTCPNCGQINEFVHDTCWSCGKPLPVLSNPSKNNDTPLWRIYKFFFGLMVLGSVLIFIALVVGLLISFAIIFAGLLSQL